jgi:hypothetical protein
MRHYYNAFTATTDSTDAKRLGAVCWCLGPVYCCYWHYCCSSLMPREDVRSTLNVKAVKALRLRPQINKCRGLVSYGPKPQSCNGWNLKLQTAKASKFSRLASCCISV